MASTIVTKNSSTASAVPLTGDLTQGELAVNVTDKRLFTKNSGGTVVELGTNPASLALPNGTANGVAYLNGSKVVTTGSALTFDGSKLGVGSTSNSVVTIGYTSTAPSLTSASGSGFNLVGSSSVRLVHGSNSAAPYDTWIQATSFNNDTFPISLNPLGGNILIGTEVNAISGARLQISDGTITQIEGYFSGGVSYQGTYSNHPVAWLINNTERMRLDSSGNLGLGVTPSAWSQGRAFEMLAPGIGLWNGSGSPGSTYVLNNAYYNAGFKYGVTGQAAHYYQYQGQHVWSTAPSGTAGTAITFTQAMTLDASGQLGIGATSPSATLHVTTGNATVGLFATSRASGGYIQYSLGASGTSIGYMGSAGQISTTGGTNDFSLRAENNLLFNAGGNTERARIDSSGNLLVGTTTASNTPSGGHSFNYGSGQSSYGIGHVTGTASGTYYHVFNYNGSAIGSVTQSGTTAVLYNVTSDQRLKENIVDAPEFGSVIDAMQVRSYDWKADGNHQRAGFVAQELVTVAPEAVHQPADPDEMMAVDYSKLVPMLVKEIQSLRQRVAQLEGK